MPRRPIALLDKMFFTSCISFEGLALKLLIDIEVPRMIHNRRLSNNVRSHVDGVYSHLHMQLSFHIKIKK